MELGFIALVRDGGGSSLITVPHAYVKNGQVEIGKLYRVTLQEVTE